MITKQFLTTKANKFQLKYSCLWLRFFLKRELSRLSTSTAFAFWNSISHNFRSRNPKRRWLDRERFLLVNLSSLWLLLSNTLSILWIVLFSITFSVRLPHFLASCSSALVKLTQKSCNLSIWRANPPSCFIPLTSDDWAGKTEWVCVAVVWTWTVAWN